MPGTFLGMWPDWHIFVRIFLIHNRGAFFLLGIQIWMSEMTTVYFSTGLLLLLHIFMYSICYIIKTLLITVF